MTIETPAKKPNYTLTFTHDEVQALGALLDVALKSGGLQLLKQVNHFVSKMEAAEPDKAHYLEIEDE